MALNASRVCLGSKARGYQNRVMVYAHRRQKARYLAPKNAHVHSPLANKEPEEYHKTWDPRTGVEWHNRMRNRNHYRHWPWARWTDDPVRMHEDTTSRRVFSAAVAAANEGVPEWNYYAEVGQEYRIPSHFPLTHLAPFIYQYTGKVWSKEHIEAHISAVQDGTGLRTIQDLVANPEALQMWARAGTVPRGLLQHLKFVAADVVLQNQKKAFRVSQHEAGVLRTPDMERYYALPYLRGPAMPVKLEQPSGEYPWGKYTNMIGTGRIHPLQVPDARYGLNMYPA